MNKIFIRLLLPATLMASASLQANNLSEQGQIYLQLQQMQQEIMELRGLVEEQQYQLRKLEQQYQPGKNDNTASATTAATVKPQQQVKPGDPEREKEFYDAAFSLIRQRDFDNARQAFDIFLKKYPDGQYAANAYYWYGEVCLVQEDLQEAGSSFAKVIHSWPEHSKAVDSMYKLAMVEKRLERIDQAKQILQTIVREHPRSSAAKLAQQELQRL